MQIILNDEPKKKVEKKNIYQKKEEEFKKLYQKKVSELRNMKMHRNTLSSATANSGNAPTE